MDRKVAAEVCAPRLADSYSAAARNTNSQIMYGQAGALNAMTGCH
jgi:hypothetical protein